jgi:hypothetical protein
MVRVFNRYNHYNLNGDNRPKVVEVVLKYVKFHDGIDFYDTKGALSIFDRSLRLEFIDT